jgi:hypothetical protein
MWCSVYHGGNQVDRSSYSAQWYHLSIFRRKLWHMQDHIEMGRLCVSLQALSSKVKR